jgi:hypothetical protein
MDGEAIRRIQEQAGTDQFEPDGETVFYSKPVYRPPLPEEPLCAALRVHTLQGLVDYWKREAEAGNAKAFGLIHIRSHACVSIVSNIRGERRQREVFVTAEAENVLRDLVFGKYFEAEAFVPMLQTLFAPGENDRDRLIRMLSTLTSEAVRTDVDDGVTQVVSVRRGVSLHSETRVPNPVMLAPWRTFREIEQPVSPFVLRMKGDGDEAPECALFEADGGSWKLAAIQSIKAYLVGALEGVLILG